MDCLHLAISKVDLMDGMSRIYWAELIWSVFIPLPFCCQNFRILVYEYVNNGNLEQWLRGDMCDRGYLTWEARMKILLGTAKA